MHSVSGVANGVSGLGVCETRFGENCFPILRFCSLTPQLVSAPLSAGTGLCGNTSGSRFLASGIQTYVRDGRNDSHSHDFKVQPISDLSYPHQLCLDLPDELPRFRGVSSQAAHTHGARAHDAMHDMSVSDSGTSRDSAFRIENALWLSPGPFLVVRPICFLCP